MPKHYSRKDFLKLSAATGASLLLAACGGSDKDEKNSKSESESESQPSKPTALKNSQTSSASSLQLITNTDAGYEELRQGFNKRINHHPAVIAVCKSSEDVAQAIRYAHDKNLAVAIKSGGHSMEGFSSNEQGLVINLSKMNHVKLLGHNRVQVGPGCTLSRLYDHLLPKSLLVPAGSCGTVGVGGLTMGGGYGLFARQYGLTCDSLLEARFVDGNGVIHSTKNDNELLWALRGGGAGNFGVVTDLIFQAYPSPARLQAHHFKARKLNTERATNILEKWFSFAAQLPSTCFSAFVQNGATLNILVTNSGVHSKELQALLQGLAKETDEFRSDAPKELSKVLKNYYGSLVPLYFKNSSAGLYKSFEDIQAFIPEVLEKTIHTRGMIFQVNTLGGKIADPVLEKVSSYPHRAYHFISELQAYWQHPKEEEKLTQVSQECLKIFQEHGISAQYINYCSLDFQNWQEAYYGKNYTRLQAVKQKYDPKNTIRHPQSIQPLYVPNKDV
ncbi:MAG: FAD-binding protein [Undibacterium sp.]|nr:FAD-binding protein [Undibacterium sp.]